MGKHKRFRPLEQDIKKLWRKDKHIVNENANKDSTVFNTQRDLTAGIVAKYYAMRYQLPENVAAAHEAGDIHFHDLDYSPYQPLTNCCLIDIAGMLEHGFQIGNASVEPPHSIQTAAAQIAQIIANVSSSQYGGCSVDRIDEILAHYAECNYEKHLVKASEWVEPSRREDYALSFTKKDIYDAMQSLEYEINTLYSSNGQTPFVTLGFGLGTSWIEREIQQAILNVRLTGLGKQRQTAIFPKLVFSLKRGVNLQATDPNYDVKKLALECSAKRMYPDVLNYDKLVEITGDFKAPMGCRSFLPAWKNAKGEFENAGRMNIGVVTLNLPRLAIRSQANSKRFWQLFAEQMVTMKEALLYRIERTKEAKPENAPILYQYGAFGERLQKGEAVDTLFKDGRSTISIGYLGLYELAAHFFGAHPEKNTEAKAFILSVLQKLNDYAAEWREETGYWFSVYATPSESLADRFNRMDRERYGEIAFLTDKDYYQNSFHYDVREKVSAFEKIDYEKAFAPLSSGGFIHYCEYPVLVHNLAALESVWDYAYDRVAYLGTNTPIDKCFECGFEGEFSPTAKGFECPTCHNHNPLTCDVVKRTCGYLGNPVKRPMVHGRHEEIVKRVKHTKKVNDE